MSLILKNKQLDDQEDELVKWREEVLKQHFETKRLAERVIDEGRNVRIKLTKELDETKAIVDKWNFYTERCKSSSRELSKVVEAKISLKRQVKSKFIPRSMKSIPSLVTCHSSHHERKCSGWIPTISSRLKTTSKFKLH